MFSVCLYFYVRFNMKNNSISTHETQAVVSYIQAVQALIRRHTRFCARYKCFTLHYMFRGGLSKVYA